VEDSSEDAELTRFSLRGAPFEFEMTRVETEGDYLAQLDAGLPDAVIADFNLPSFSGPRALRILEERGLEIPVLLVSHHIGEEGAIAAMQQGACDYLRKGNLDRLPKAIESAIDRCRARAERARALEALRESESLKRSILNSLDTRIALLDGGGMIIAVNKAWEEFSANRSRMGILDADVGANYLDVLQAAATEGNPFAEAGVRGIRAVIAGERKFISIEYQVNVGAGIRWFLARAMPLEGGKDGVVVSHEDITDRMLAHIALEDANKRLQVLSKRVLGVQEDERRAISRELHDDVGQTLFALTIGLHRLEKDPGGGRAELVTECLGAAQAAIEKLRELALELRPPQLDQLGLEEALAWLAERQRAATGLDIRCQFAGLENRRAPLALEGVCYRIAQEALSNATRHARAKNILINVALDDHLLEVTIRDDGAGFDESDARRRAPASGSMGLIGMEERAQLAGGRLRLRSVLGAGTVVSAVFPLDRSRDERYTVGAAAPEA
jgi:signal transduction histidine kinase